ncbi:hypothetical protein EDC04DRAFT_2600329 [Pisolithus marmoratus]|nr:hypothetical protein EDC04DRAFT_2600329 [Pisolithus marmoratus]
MHLWWFQTQAESFPLTPLNHNGDLSEEHTLLLSSIIVPHAMNIDDLWSDATSPTISKPSKPPIDAHAIIATVENPCSEAAANTAVVIRSMESNLVDNPCPVAATNTAIVSSMGSNSGKCPALVDTAQVDTPPLSDNAHKPFISSGRVYGKIGRAEGKRFLGSSQGVLSEERNMKQLQYVQPCMHNLGPQWGSGSQEGQQWWLCSDCSGGDMMGDGCSGLASGLRPFDQLWDFGEKMDSLNTRLGREAQGKIREIPSLHRNSFFGCDYAKVGVPAMWNNKMTVI